MSTSVIVHCTRSHTFGMPGLALIASLLTLGGCDDAMIDQPGEANELRDLEIEPYLVQTTCDPMMSVFPIAAAHNIAYDEGSCKAGVCELSCPDANPNTDWGVKPSGSVHHGNDIFADHGAPLVAVASGTIREVGVSISSLGVRSTTSGIRVRLRDECGWEYYYGHLDEAVVAKDQHVQAGDLIGYLGKTGTSTTNLHFNVSPKGVFSSDIDPFPLLTATSPTACDGGEPAPQTVPAPGCMLGEGQVLRVNQSLTSCNGDYTLSMQLDGNLVLQDKGGVMLWSSQTAGNTGQAVVMQADGNLVMSDGYQGVGAAVWATSTAGHPGATLSVDDGGNVKIFDGEVEIWTAL
jgi:Peptidase family M23